jgi:hypothetical protein
MKSGRRFLLIETRQGNQALIEQTEDGKFQVASTSGTLKQRCAKAKLLRSCTYGDSASTVKDLYLRLEVVHSKPEDIDSEAFAWLTSGAAGVQTPRASTDILPASSARGRSRSQDEVARHPRRLSNRPASAPPCRAPDQKAVLLSSAKTAASDCDDTDDFHFSQDVEENVQSTQVLSMRTPTSTPQSTPSSSPVHRPGQAPEALLSQTASMQGFQLDAPSQVSAAFGDSVDFSLNRNLGGMMDFANGCQVYNGQCMPECPVQYVSMLVPVRQDGSIQTWYVNNDRRMQESSFVFDGTQFDEQGQPVAEAIGEPCDAQLGQESVQEANIDFTESRFKQNRKQNIPLAMPVKPGLLTRLPLVTPIVPLPPAPTLIQETPTPPPPTGHPQQVPQHEGEVDYTTAMLRGLPNKYTRETLINQFLQQEFEKQFDFIYLPIDFKNKCNVGYAFINFLSVETCQRFVIAYHGMSAREIRPDSNSQKVLQVTKANFQGFEVNVTSLRNNPVMTKLRENPDWMPLIFDEHGVERPFPEPERPLVPIKPRNRCDHRAREKCEHTSTRLSLGHLPHLQ